MKSFALMLAMVLLTACANDSSTKNEMPPAPMPGEATEMEENDDDMVRPDEEDGVSLSNENGVVLTLEDLQERQMIESPLEIEGLVRRDWFFEGSFPITLMTLEETVVKEWYGSGDWLEPLEGDTFETMSGDDMIEFEADIEFEAPEGGDMGKIRFGKSMIADAEEGGADEYVELMILWP